MKLILRAVMSLLLFLPCLAGTAPSCGVVNENASAELKEHSPTAEVLRSLPGGAAPNAIKAAAARLNEEGERPEGLDPVIGHLRLMTNGERDVKVAAYEVLWAMDVGSRSDVADQFITGLNDLHQRVRAISAWGLITASPGKRESAGNALAHRLEKEVADPDNQAWDALMESLAKVASPAQKDQIATLRNALVADTPPGVIEPLFAAWKSKLAQAVVQVLGPADAIELFSTLDASKRGERFGLEGGVDALVLFTLYDFEGASLAHRNEVRDLLRGFGVQVLSKQQTSEEAQRDARVRSAVVSGLFKVVLLPTNEKRQVDVDQVRIALQAAIALERSGSTVAGEINKFLKSL